MLYCILFQRRRRQSIESITLCVRIEKLKEGNIGGGEHGLGIYRGVSMSRSRDVPPIERIE